MISTNKSATVPRSELASIPNSRSTLRKLSNTSFLSPTKLTKPTPVRMPRCFPRQVSCPNTLGCKCRCTTTGQHMRRLIISGVQPRPTARSIAPHRHSGAAARWMKPQLETVGFMLSASPRWSLANREGILPSSIRARAAEYICGTVVANNVAITSTSQASSMMSRHQVRPRPDSPAGPTATQIEITAPEPSSDGRR